MVRGFRTLAVLVALATAVPGLAGNIGLRAEVVVADSSVDLSRNWNPVALTLSPSTFPPELDDEPGAGVRELTVAFDLDRGYALFASWQPKLELGFGETFDRDPDGSLEREASGFSSVEAIDLGVERVMTVGERWRFEPRLGLTHLRRRDIVTRRDSWTDPIQPRNEYRADVHFSQWGVVAGSEIAVRAHDRVEVVVNAAVRFATGTASVTDEETRWYPGQADGDTEVGSSSASSSAATATVRLGVRADVTEHAAVEAGWSVQRWRSDGGPGTFEGAYLAASVSF